MNKLIIAGDVPQQKNRIIRFKIYPKKKLKIYNEYKLNYRPH